MSTCGRHKACATTWANVRMMHALRGMVAACDAAGVPVMLLKGAALNATLYDRPDERPMRDLDILVRPEHVDLALDALASIGARPWRPLLREDFFPRYYHHLELRLDGLWPITIELHARPLRPLRCQALMPDDALWPSARPVNLGGVTAYVPSDAHMLVHLAAHLGLDGGHDVKWSRDLARLIATRGDTLDWDRVTADAREWRLGAAVAKGFALAERDLGPLALPDAARQLGGGWRDRLLLRTAPLDERSPAAHVLGSLLTCPDLRLSAGFLVAVLVPGRRHMLDWYGREHRGWLAAAHLQRALQPLLRPLKWLAMRRDRLRLERSPQGKPQLVAAVHLTPGSTVGWARVEQDADGWTQPPTYGLMRHLVLDAVPNTRIDGARLIAVRQIRRGDAISVAPRWPASAGQAPSPPPDHTAERNTLFDRPALAA